MRAVILAAGYATRLYPLTKHQPKSLLPVGKRPVIDWILDQLRPVPMIQEVVVVINDAFAKPFAAWQRGVTFPKPLRLINDGSTSNENRLGAIRDLAVSLERTDRHEDLLVLAGDNIVLTDLAQMVKTGQAHRPASTVGVHRLANVADATKYATVTLTADGRITAFEEKPRHPTTPLVSICLYYLPTPVLPRIGEYLQRGRQADAPGYFIEWLSQQETVYGYVFQDPWYDIGDLGTYRQTCAALGGAAA